MVEFQASPQVVEVRMEKRDEPFSKRPLISMPGGHPAMVIAPNRQCNSIGGNRGTCGSRGGGRSRSPYFGSPVRAAFGTLSRRSWRWTRTWVSAMEDEPDRIELDLRPSGRYYRAWAGGDLDDDASYEERETDEGDVIAEGTTAVDGYGNTLVERIQFIVGVIRTHLRRQNCTVHTVERDELELLLGRPLVWCPECGTELS